MYELSRTKLNYMNILKRISILLATWPPKFCKNNKLELQLYRLYSIFIVTTLSVLYAGTILSSLVLNDTLQPGYIEIAATTAITLFATQNILDSALFNTDNYHLFAHLVEQTEDYIKLTTKKHQLIRFYFELATIHIYLTATFYFDAALTLEFNKSKTTATTFTCAWIYVETYSRCISILLIHNYAFILRRYLSQLNRTLKRLIKMEAADRNKISCIFGPVVHNKMTNTVECVCNMRQAYSHISRTIELFNDVFGWRFVMIFGSHLLGICHITEIVTIFLIRSESVNTDTIVGLTMWSIAFVVSRRCYLIFFSVNSLGICFMIF